MKNVVLCLFYEYCLYKNHIIFFCRSHVIFIYFFTFLHYFLNFDVFNIFLLLKSVYIECSCIFVIISDQTRLQNLLWLLLNFKNKLRWVRGSLMHEDDWRRRTRWPGSLRTSWMTMMSMYRMMMTKTTLEMTKQVGAILFSYFWKI